MTEAAATEKARLAALNACGILDTPREPGFDSIVFTLAQIIRVPIVLLALVGEDRIWVKASVGKPQADWLRIHAFCRSVLEAGSLLTVEDIAADPRFGPVEAGPGAPIHFAVGVPIRGPNNHGIGCLCAFEGRLRTLQARHAASLQHFADQASEMMQNRVPG